MSGFRIPTDPDRSFEYYRARYRPDSLNCDCEYCRTAARKTLPRMFGRERDKIREKMRGRRFEGCKYVNAEEALSDAWKDRAEDVLWSLVLQEFGGENGFADDGRQRLFSVMKLDRGSRQLVASVIQWLGTPVGMGFLHKALGDAGYSLVLNYKQDRNHPLYEKVKLLNGVRAPRFNLISSPAPVEEMIDRISERISEGI